MPSIYVRKLELKLLAIKQAALKLEKPKIEAANKQAQLDQTTELLLKNKCAEMEAKNNNINWDLRLEVELEKMKVTDEQRATLASR